MILQEGRPIGGAERNAIHNCLDYFDSFIFAILWNHWRIMNLLASVASNRIQSYLPMWRADYVWPTWTSFSGADMYNDSHNRKRSTWIRIYKIATSLEFVWSVTRNLDLYTTQNQHIYSIFGRPKVASNANSGRNVEIFAWQECQIANKLLNFSKIC